MLHYAAITMWQVYGAPMNWSVVSAVADLIAASAVIISLIYLARQIRLNTEEIAAGNEASKLAAFERNIESGNHIRELLILYPDLTEIFLKGQKNFSELNKQERVRFSMLLRNIFNSAQGAYVRHLSTKHDPQDFEGTEKVIDEILVNPGAREWLRQANPDWRPEFKALVENRLQLIEVRLKDSN